MTATPFKNRPIDTGQQARMEILRRDAERTIIEPLRIHKWNAEIEREANDLMWPNAAATGTGLL